MKAPQTIKVDFESEKIQNRPVYPPRPVGVSIQWPHEKKPVYYAWGHPTENNCKLADAKRELRKAWDAARRRELALLFQNAKFDVDVAETHMGMKPVPWDMVHDTMYLLFMDDPHAPSHSLKPSAERILGMKPEEQDAVRQWLIDNGIVASNNKSWGAFISQAPGGLVGKYADGDSIRTDKLFKKLWPMIVERGMQEAYDRERELMPILLENERVGVRADLELLRHDVPIYREAMLTVDMWLRKKLKAPNLSIDSDAELLEALLTSGYADKGLLKWTKGGKKKGPQLSAAKDSLEGAITDQKIVSVLQYRAKLATFNGTFLEPWLGEAEMTGGIVHPSWNQVKQYGNYGDAGARTGRMSASRFMNAPKEAAEAELGKAGFHFPKHIKGLPPLPFVRNYLLPDKGELWGKRDYSQQEFRILAHYEGGALLQKFKENPKTDVHKLVAAIMNDKDIEEVLQEERDDAKGIGFGLLYGMGIDKLAAKLRTDVPRAKSLKKQYMAALPGIKVLQDGLKQNAKAGLPIYTWGGREYYCEKPKEVDGRVRTFEYKLTNYLVQGSAADCTKQAIINYNNHPKKRGRLLLTVHDEIDFSIGPKHLEEEMRVLAECMGDVEFDVPMLSDGAAGERWGQLKKVKD